MHGQRGRSRQRVLGLSGARMGLADGTLESRGVGYYMECEGSVKQRGWGGRKRIMDKEGRVACFLPSSIY